MSTACASCLSAHPELAARINEPLFDFKQPAIQLALGNLAMLDLLIAHGADINAKSAWEMGGFGILENATPEQMPALLERGARIDVWSAAKFGMADRLRAFLKSDPSLVNAKGGDGKRPLHYAASVAIAQLLLDHGAEIDALDDDHHSTAAQYLVSEHPEVARFLLARGARSDLLLAAGARRSRSRPPASRRGPGRDPDAGEPGLVPDDRYRQERRTHLSMDARLLRLGVRCGAQARAPGRARSAAGAGRSARSPARCAVERRYSPRPTRSSRHRPDWSNRRRPTPRGSSPTPPATTRPPRSKPCSRAAFR